MSAGAKWAKGVTQERASRDWRVGLSTGMVNGPGRGGYQGRMPCTRGLTKASQQVLPSAWAASSSGRK